MSNSQDLVLIPVQPVEFLTRKPFPSLPVLVAVTSHYSSAAKPLSRALSHFSAFVSRGQGLISSQNKFVSLCICENWVDLSLVKGRHRDHRKPFPKSIYCVYAYKGYKSQLSTVTHLCLDLLDFSGFWHVLEVLLERHDFWVLLLQDGDQVV